MQVIITTCQLCWFSLNGSCEIQSGIISPPFTRSIHCVSYTKGGYKGSTWYFNLNWPAVIMKLLPGQLGTFLSNKQLLDLQPWCVRRQLQLKKKKTNLQASACNNYRLCDRAELQAINHPDQWDSLSCWEAGRRSNTCTRTEKNWRTGGPHIAHVTNMDTDWISC